MSLFQNHRKAIRHVTSYECVISSIPPPFFCHQKGDLPDKQIRHRTRYFRRILPLPVGSYKGTSNLSPIAADTSTFSIQLDHQKGARITGSHCTISWPSVSFLVLKARSLIPGEEREDPFYFTSFPLSSP
ncbi:uncharacterized protein NPIL_108131 [Nephila pilipes]|uniref:Uncharacterized protein n=1 Tax=Nephila pilipes TaxID=299642 RepID=A0A8X6MXJ7_NEPPI|nr:uncharacterized protein NPIL_108131 [Nephila pilipes]